MGDARLAVERADEANACYVRRLCLASTDVDLVRIRLRRLARLHEDLCSTRPESCARERLLVHAWLEGTLRIPAENGWLDGHVSRLMARAQSDPSWPPRDRYRRFALLLYLDRSQPLSGTAGGSTRGPARDPDGRRRVLPGLCWSDHATTIANRDLTEGGIPCAASSCP